MSRVRISVASRKYRKKILKRASGFYGRKNTCFSLAKESVDRANQYNYRDRKNRKREFRALWIQRINAKARELNVKYSTFMFMLKQANIEVNRKILAEMAMNHPESFAALLNSLQVPVQGVK